VEGERGVKLFYTKLCVVAVEWNKIFFLFFLGEGIRIN
jgi:hypothetical protein